jgi:hypothetical protein
MRTLKSVGRSRGSLRVRTAVVAGFVVAGTLVGAGMADAAPAPVPQGGFQTCVAQGVPHAIFGWRSLPLLRRGPFLADQIARVNRDCRDRYQTTYTRSTSQTVTRPRDGVNVISVRCDPRDTFVRRDFATVRGNVRNVVAEGVTHRPEGYFVTYHYNRVPTEVKLTVTCRRS